MSGQGAPSIDIRGAEDLRVAVVASSWHTVVMDGLVDGARAALGEAGITAEVTRVPGSFELPVVAAALAGTHDAVVALGVIIIVLGAMVAVIVLAILLPILQFNALVAG